MKLLWPLFVVLIAQITFGDFTIHVISPWKDDASANRRDSLRMAGNEEVGYYPGSPMVNEGGGWFYYTYKEVSKGAGVKFTLTTWIGPEEWNGKVDYGRSIDIDSLFAQVPVSAEDIWIVLNPDSTKFPTVYETPPNGMVVYILNPWKESSPKMIVNNSLPMQMRLHEELCGWYKYYYAGVPDSLQNVTFTDYYEKEVYTQAGLSAGDGIDLSDILRENDTAYILPRPYPFGPPAITTTFPGRLGDCSTRKISGIFRDWKLDNESFFNNPVGASSGHKGMVMPTLTAPDYKPKLTDDPSANTLNSTKLETWYQTDTFPDGSTNDTCIDLYMIKGYDGRWTFDSDVMGGFFPLDDFDNPNNIQYLDKVNQSDPNGTMHNYHFSMEMHLQFVYHEGIGLEFDFRGDDDVWIYVNNILAIDLGGLQDKAYDTLRLDQDKNKLNIVDDELYNMDIFFAERNPIGSNFLIKTTMDLRNSGELYYKDFPITSGITQYDIWQQVETEQNDCGLTRLTDGEELSNVDFYIVGPQFTDTTSLPPGLHFGGIQVDENKYRITIDSTHVTGLKPGDYRIIFISTYNKDRSGYLMFTVPPVPDHLDLLPDSVQLDTKNDMNIDSLHMNIESDSLLLYAVVRDSYGSYIEDGSALIWSSSNESVITITPLTTDKARAMIKKVDGGSAWIVVRQGTLKADSLFINAEAKPAWPLIASGIITDGYGDIVPNMVHIVLTDTFKTGQKLTKVELSYRSNVYTLSAEDCLISGTTISVPFITLTAEDSKPTGEVTIVIDANGNEKRHTKNATDGVGPILIAAEMLEKEELEPDVLYLTFSEKVLMSTLIGNQLQHIAKGTTDTTVLKISRIESVINDSTFAVVLVQSALVIHQGDLLRLVPGVSGGTISDVNSNLPHLRNWPVVIGIRKGAALMKSAWYKDTDADGIIDLLVIHFKRAVAMEEFGTLMVRWGEDNYTIDPTTFSSGGDSLITVKLSGVVTDQSTIVTSGSMFISQTFKAVPTLSRTAQVIDSAAPVLREAVLRFGGYDESGVKKFDTLIVEFSEEVQVNGFQPFVIEPPGSVLSYKFTVNAPEMNRDQATFLISAIDPSTASIAKGDSIRINELNMVADSGYVYQINEHNRCVLLSIIQPPVEWYVQITPNPLTTKNEVQTLKIVSKMPAEVALFKASITIYDGVGSIVKEVPDLEIEDKSFVYRWNGTNKHGRFVGSGTYVTFIQVYDGNLPSWRKQVKMGISWGSR